MQLIKFLAVLFISLISVQATNIEESELTLSGNLQEATVEFTITNYGELAKNVTYIIIQDQVLVLEQGGTSIPSGGTVTIHVPKQSSGDYEYTLEVTSDVNGIVDKYTVIQ